MKVPKSVPVRGSGLALAMLLIALLAPRSVQADAPAPAPHLAYSSPSTIDDSWEQR
jgi:hypothetical protein